MAEGGFVVTFDKKIVKRCYAVSFDYDEWSYAINEKEKRRIPRGTKKITIEAEVE